MKKNNSTEYIVDIIEAAIRFLIRTGLTREQAIQVMLSQLAVQTDPKIMQMAVKVSEKYADAFKQNNWEESDSRQKQDHIAL